MISRKFDSSIYAIYSLYAMEKVVVLINHQLLYVHGYFRLFGKNLFSSFFVRFSVVILMNVTRFLI